MRILLLCGIMAAVAEAQTLTTLATFNGTNGYGPIAPGYAGLYQVAIQIPASLSNGDYPVIAAIDGVQSPASTLITIQQ
jgi:uncharacterized protein (TIGR03437 family)